MMVMNAADASLLEEIDPQTKEKTHKVLIMSARVNHTPSAVPPPPAKLEYPIGFNAVVNGNYFQVCKLVYKILISCVGQFTWSAI